MGNFGCCALICCLAFRAIAPAFTFLTKVSLSRLLLLLDVCNVQSTFRKPYAAHLLVLSHLPLDHSFKVKLWCLSVKVPISRLLLALEVWNVHTTFRKLHQQYCFLYYFVQLIHSCIWLQM